MNFRTGKQMPTKYAPEGGNSKKRKAGRPTNDEQIIAFQKTCIYFEENDEEQLKLSELVEIMQSYLKDSEMSAYERKHMQRKLVDHYGDEIIIASGDGKSTLITLRKSVDSILRKFYDEPKTDIQSQKELLCKTAVQIIKADIKNISANAEKTYPTLDKLEKNEALSFQPVTLRSILENLLLNKNNHNDSKIAAIGQCTIQAVRPRKILAPLQIGLAVLSHSHFAQGLLLIY